MKRIRVLEIGKSTAGIGTYLRWLARGLDLERFQLSFICLSEGGKELASELAAYNDIHSVSWPMKRFKIDIFADLVLMVKMAKFIRSEKFDLIHAHGSKAGLLARVAAIGSAVPVIYSPHCFSFHKGVNPIIANILAMIERIAARFLTARIITVSDGEQKLAESYRVGPPSLFVTVYSGVDAITDSYSFKNDFYVSGLKFDKSVPLVGSIGRLGVQKSPFDFVRMAVHVHSQMPEVQFLWAGSGPLEHASQVLSKKMGLEGVCHFIGEQRDVQSFLRCLDVFVLPSLWEGFPIVLLEAMAAGVPIVATEIPGTNEAILSGMNGWLVPAGDAVIMAEKVIWLLQDRSQASRFVNSSRQRLQSEFSRKNMINSIQDIYFEVFNKNANSDLDL